MTIGQVAWFNCGMTAAELVTLVERQMADEGLIVNDAVENVADELGESWTVVWDRYWSAKEDQS